MNKRQNTRGVVRFWGLQFLVITILAILAYIKEGQQTAISALLGGLVCFIPNAYFALKLFKYQGARAARQIINNFYAGEALKIMISAFLFAMVFILCRITPWAFFGTYIAVQMTYWVAPWIIVFKQKRPESD